MVRPPEHEKLRSGIWEIKSGKIRIFCFFASGHLLVLAFGIRKKSAKTRTRDIDKAIAMKAEFDSRRKEKNGN